MPFIGEAVAMATVLCWTGSVQFFAAASREVGAIPVNIIRLTVALLLFATLLWWKDGSPVPLHFPANAWLYLSLSGIVLSKTGMQTDAGYLDAFAATEIRAIAAFFCFILFFTVTHKWRNVQKALANTRAVVYTSVGAALGPFLGVSLSLLALHYLTSGVASTFFALVPICIIPFSIYLHKERVSARAVAGAVVAVCGVYLLSS